MALFQQIKFVGHRSKLLPKIESKYFVIIASNSFLFLSRLLQNGIGTLQAIVEV